MNLFEYAFSVEQNFFKNPLNECGYESFTTFYSDLTIGECCEGIKGVKDTIENVKKNWLDDYKYFTEFIMSVNHKQFEMDYRIRHKQSAPKESAKKYLEFYAKEFIQLQELFYKHYEGNQEALSYYYRVTD